MHKLQSSSFAWVTLSLAIVSLSASAFAQPQVEQPAAGHTAEAQMEQSPSVSSAAAPSATESARVIVVSVESVSEDLNVQPAANVPVKLSIILPPHQIVDTLHGTTNELGEATFETAASGEHQAFASAQLGEREVFGDSGVALDQAGRARIFVREERVTSDLSSVFAPRVITIAELWEDYIVFTQIWTLASSAPVQVVPDSSTKTSGLEIPLPEDASGIRVIQPQEGVSVSESSLYYQLPVESAGAGRTSAPSLVVRFSVKHENASSLAWEQPLLFAVENASVVIPQGTQHRRFERLDVSLDVPLCESSSVPGAMCFEDIRNRAEGVPMLEGVAVKIAGGGRTQGTPSVMRVQTSGWPTPVPVATIVSAIAGGIALLAIFGFVIFEFRHRRRGTSGEVTLEHLVVERERRLSQAGRLRARLDRAELLESEYELELARIREELAMIEQRIRTTRNVASATQGSDATAGA